MQNFAEIARFVENSSSNDKSGGGKLRDRFNHLEDRRRFIEKALPTHVAKYVLRPAKLAKSTAKGSSKASMTKAKRDPSALYRPSASAEGSAEHRLDVERGDHSPRITDSAPLREVSASGVFYAYY